MMHKLGVIVEVPNSGKRLDAGVDFDFKKI